ncbi:GNAT family N-acetyltransferase [Sinomicrobium sp.]
MSTNATSEYVDIITFKPEYASAFADLNYAWVNKYFKVEAHDHEILDNPLEKIINPGGQILLAIKGDEVVGTAALLPIDQDTYELTKIAVSEHHKGHKIGRRLILRAIDYALRQGKKRLVLQTNTKLTPAMNLYISSGFKAVDLDEDLAYERVNMKMELRL